MESFGDYRTREDLSIAIVRKTRGRLLWIGNIHLQHKTAIQGDEPLAVVADIVHQRNDDLRVESSNSANMICTMSTV